MAKQKKNNNIPNENLHYIYPDDINPEIAYLNKTSCLNPIEFRTQNCNGCNHESRCVYVNKYKYMRLN